MAFRSSFIQLNLRYFVKSESLYKTVLLSTTVLPLPGNEVYRKYSFVSRQMNDRSTSFPSQYTLKSIIVVFIFLCFFFFCYGKKATVNDTKKLWKWSLETTNLLPYKVRLLFKLVYQLKVFMRDKIGLCVRHRQINKKTRETFSFSFACELIAFASPRFTRKRERLKNRYIEA